MESYNRIWWFIMVSLSVGLCAFLILKVWSKWNDNPVIVSLASANTPIWEEVHGSGDYLTIPFPAVTICSMLKTDPRLFNYSAVCNADENSRKYNESYVNDRMIFDALSANACYNDCTLEDSDVINQTHVRKYLEVALKSEDMFFWCSWGDADSCESIFRPVLTEFGLCFTANMISPSEMYTDVVEYEKSHDFQAGHPRWTISDGYPDNSVNAYPLRVQSTGEVNSIDVTLFSSGTDPACAANYEGFQITLHAPNVFPRVFDNFLWAPLNVDNVITLQPTMITTSETLRSYSPERRQCYFSHEKSLRFFKEYDQDNCQMECLVNLTIAACRCVPFGLPHDASTPICGAGSLHCTSMVQRTRFKLEIDNIEKFLKPSEIKLYKVARRCRCLPGCTSISYDASVSQTTLRSSKPSTKRNSSISNTRVSLYFKEAQFMPLRRSELYGITDFLANCGGLLGVCLGFSILSLVEVVYFFVVKAMCDIHKRRVGPTED